MGATESIFYDDEPPIENSDAYPESYPPVPQDVRNYRPAAPNGGPRVARRPKQRPRPRPGGGNELPLKTMEGLILGLPSSGKRTLTERLKGKDPFENPGEETIQDPAEENQKSVAMVPYQAPPNCSAWDRLQIKVQTSAEVSLDSNIDFGVVLINPREEPQKVQAYLVQVISAFVNNQQSNSSLCLCFLVNFRDLYSKKNRGIQEADVKQCVLGIFQQLAEHVPNTDRVLLEFGTTSLFNCYGLATLHHFIYAAYLRSKQTELEQQLALVQDALSKPLAAPRIKYKEFSKMVNASMDPSSSEAVSNQANNLRQQRNKTVQEVNGSHDAAGKNPQPNPSRRKVLGNDPTEEDPVATTTPAVRKAYETSRQALEDFLASDDEEERIGNARHPNSYDDDDEDDFFYNEAGERCSVRSGKVISAKQAKTVDEGPSKTVPPSSDSSFNKANKSNIPEDSSEPTPGHPSENQTKSNAAPVETSIEESANEADQRSEQDDGSHASASSFEKEPNPDVEDLRSSKAGEDVVDTNGTRVVIENGEKAATEIADEELPDATDLATEASCDQVSPTSREATEPSSEPESPSQEVNKSNPDIAEISPSSSDIRAEQNDTSDGDPPTTIEQSMADDDNDKNIEVRVHDDQSVHAEQDTQRIEEPKPLPSRADDSESDDEFFIGESTADDQNDEEDTAGNYDANHAAAPHTMADESVNSAINSQPNPTGGEDGNQDSDEEFFIGEVGTKGEGKSPQETTTSDADEGDQANAPLSDQVDQLTPKSTNVEQGNEDDRVAVPSAEPASNPKPALSAAAQAAIAAAKKEAELMLHQTAITPNPEKKAKKKKDSKKKEKKLKKEQKKAKRKDKTDRDDSAE